ncbi:hypothetical protein [Mycobacterium sp. SMC-4]|uniref:hypothetical protein n=1 Tax=Mycobacterium sp. SMC-4 TaxID=2857059 RepID=UPI0021B2AB70|nr:hypothetical protein [Mycobacterium sp. SMC-4]UXA19578.1 hypothetical protein KXD98_08255 [Mycobacterium sp. SMC-4]
MTEGRVALHEKIVYEKWEGYANPIERGRHVNFGDQFTFDLVPEYDVDVAGLERVTMRAVDVGVGSHPFQAWKEDEWPISSLGSIGWFTWAPG